MGLLNWNSAGVLISDEPVYGIDANPVHLLHDTLYNHTGHKIEIYTAAAKGGTKLTEGTDYSVGDEDTDLTAEAGNPVYQTVTILNSAYHEATLGGPLYFYYETVGDYVDAEDVKPRIINKTADFTVRNTVHDLIYVIDTTSGDVTVSGAMPAASLHENITIGFVKSDSGSNIVDGLPDSLTLESQGDIATYWCDGTTWHCVQPWANHGSNSDGEWKRCADGTMICRSGSVSVSSASTTPWGAIYWNGQAQTWNYPKTFVSIDSVSGNPCAATSGMYIPMTQTITTSYVRWGVARGTSDAAVRTILANLTVIGRWRT